MRDELQGIEYIRWVSEHNLCTGCGVCAAICPSSALRMVLQKNGTYSPSTDVNSCTECNLCSKVCPGYELDLPHISRTIFGAQYPVESRIGFYRQCFVGQALDKSILKKTASGGVVSGILAHALRTGWIDGAIVTRMKSDDPLTAEAFVARSVDEIYSAAKSKYTLVHFEDALDEVYQREGRYAVVGLPCHIAGIRKAQSLNPLFRSRIVLTIGLFCAQNVSAQFLRFILRRTGIARSDIQSIVYNSGDFWYEHGLTITTNSRSVSLPLHPAGRTLFGLIWGSRLFTPKRCWLCPDTTAELADISCGNPWLPEYEREPEGRTIAVVRSDLGQRIMAELKNDFSIEQIEAASVITSQVHSILFRRDRLKARLSTLRLVGQPIPHYPHLETIDSSNSFLREGLLMLGMQVASVVYSSPLGRLLPLFLISAYIKILGRFFRPWRLKGD